MTTAAIAKAAPEATMALSPKSKIEELSSSLDTANRVMVIFLVIAAVAAAVVAVATFLVVRWQGRLDKIKDAEFESYKVEAAKTIADAGAVAATANKKAADARERAAEIEDRIAPRTLSVASAEKLALVLPAYPGRTIRVVSYALDVEAAVLERLPS